MNGIALILLVGGWAGVPALVFGGLLYWFGREYPVVQFAAVVVGIAVFKLVWDLGYDMLDAFLDILFPDLRDEEG